MPVLPELCIRHAVLVKALRCCGLDGMKARSCANVPLTALCIVSWAPCGAEEAIFLPALQALLAGGCHVRNEVTTCMDA